MFLVSSCQSDDGADGMAPGDVGWVSFSAAGELPESSHEVAEKKALLSLCGCNLEVRSVRDTVGFVAVLASVPVVSISVRPYLSLSL